MYEDDEDDGLGAGFWLKGLGLAIGALIAAGIMFYVFGFAWYAWGFFGAIVLFGLIAIAFGYLYDRRDASRRRSLAG